MNKFKKQSIAALAAFGLAFSLVACGDDSSSSVGPNGDEEITSSSSEEDLSSSSKKDKSSSSASKEKSSSSTQKDKSSSSTKKDDSSSSTKEKSSSSVKEDSSSSVEEVSSSSEEETKIVGVVFDGGNYQVQEGELRTIDNKGNVSEKSLSFYQDSRVAVNGDYVYVMEGLGTDNITKVKVESISEGEKKAVVWQVSFANANPVDLAFDGENAWVALQNADSLVKISAKDGKVMKSIKTSDFAAEGQISPYVTDIELADGKLYDYIQYMRETRMLIKKEKQSNYGFYGVFVCDGEIGNINLRNSEDATHTRWNSNGCEDENDRIHARKAIQQMNKFIDAQLVKEFGGGNAGKSDISGAEEFLYMDVAYDELDDTELETVVGRTNGELQKDESSSQTTLFDDIEFGKKKLEQHGHVSIEEPTTATIDEDGELFGGKTDTPHIPTPGPVPPPVPSDEKKYF